MIEKGNEVEDLTPANLGKGTVVHVSRNGMVYMVEWHSRPGAVSTRQEKNLRDLGRASKRKLKW